MSIIKDFPKNTTRRLIYPSPHIPSMTLYLKLCHFARYCFSVNKHESKVAPSNHSIHTASVAPQYLGAEECNTASSPTPMISSITSQVSRIVRGAAPSVQPSKMTSLKTSASCTILYRPSIGSLWMQRTSLQFFAFATGSTPDRMRYRQVAHRIWSFFNVWWDVSSALFVAFPKSDNLTQSSLSAPIFCTAKSPC